MHIAGMKDYAAVAVPSALEIVPMSGNEKPSENAKPAATPKVQGEGDYEATRRFDKDEREFLKHADVPELARRAAPKTQAEAEELAKAEEIGRSHRADVPKR
jgi:hypothetical protein